MRPLLAILLLLMFVTRADALIMVHEGNDPTEDHNWPAGAVDVANLKTRGGYWEGNLSSSLESYRVVFENGRWEVKGERMHAIS